MFFVCRSALDLSDAYVLELTLIYETFPYLLSPVSENLWKDNFSMDTSQSTYVVVRRRGPTSGAIERIPSCHRIAVNLGF